ncbi:MAG TPA: glycoside hydrolase family 3 N-terminal domain-containing protein [Gemmatimonadales bacterium]|nr:glycoside hydrolase family 3 N-terminal domain-containing protein [Gemmatimonadales bacterium]
MLRFDHFVRSLPIVLVFACGRAATPEPTVTPAPLPREPDRPRPVVAAPGDTVDRLLATLTVRQKVGQLVMPWLLGDYTASDDPTMQRARMWVDSLQVGGIIISTGTPYGIAAKLNALQRRAPLPLLISADFESGTTMRMADGTPLPPQMGIGATGRPEDAYQMGRITGLEGRAVGVHLAFAPVADVNSNPANPIINTRSFGADPRDVARFVTATIRGLRDGNILSTTKHFPGHGDTDTDSHLSMPTITASWARFDSLEMIPFRAAVEAGVDAMMSAHIAVPALDGQSQLPGTLSPKVLTGILQDSLKFRGLISTDALDMGGVAKQIGADEVVIRAFEAGSDLLLMPADPAQAIDAMTRAVESGRISQARLDHSVRKLLDLKLRMGLFREREVDLAAIPEVVARREFLAIARDMTRRSLVLLKDSLGTVDALRAAPRKVALITVADGGTLGRRLATDLRAQGHTVTTVTLPIDPSSKQLAEAEAAIAANPMTVLATQVRWGSYRGTIGLLPETAALLTRLAAKKPTVLVSFGSPYVIAQVPNVASYLIAWSGTTMAEAAVAEALSGRAAITGTAPIPVPPSWPIRAGLQRPATR